MPSEAIGPEPDYDHESDALLTIFRAVLGSTSVQDRVRAMRRLVIGVGLWEYEVLLDAQASGMTWAEIGNIYGVSRQAAHRRFAGPTVVSANAFDALLDDLEQPAEVVPALARAARRARRDPDRVDAPA